MPVGLDYLVKGLSGFFRDFLRSKILLSGEFV